jgi:uncharacterized protein YegP (UPF0339 family)
MVVRFESSKHSTKRRSVATKFVLEKDGAGRFRFRLLSQGRVLASSESYTTKRAAQNAIASVKTGASGAVIDDTTAPAAPEKAPGRPAKVAKVADKAVKATKAVKRRGSAAAKAAVASTPDPTPEPAPAPAKRAPRKTAAKRKAAAS